MQSVRAVQNGVMGRWLAATGPRGVPRFIWASLLVDACLGLAYLADHVLGQPSPTLSHLFDLDREANLPTWWSASQWLPSVVFLFLVADRIVSRDRKRSWALWLLPLLCLAFSIDETVSLHEFIGVQSDVLLPGGTRTGTSLAQTGLFFLVVGVPFAVSFGVLTLVVRPFLQRPPAGFRRLIAGVVVMLIGAVGVDFLANFVEFGSPPAIVLIYIEESLEMIGGTLVLWGGYLLAVGATGWVPPP